MGNLSLGLFSFFNKLVNSAAAGKLWAILATVSAATPMIIEGCNDTGTPTDGSSWPTSSSFNNFKVYEWKY